jgi:type II secretory pathway component PulJ
MNPRSTRKPAPRRGVTLVEMLISVALLVLMMTVIVQVLVAATGSVSAMKTAAELDGSLRQLDTTLREDLRNLTAKLTPPLNPDQNLGYFEYGENSFADLQGEDGDDYIRFTVKAPAGKFFTGRMFVKPIDGASQALQANNAQVAAYYLQTQPITITSPYAEVIYFLRNGNLYRRVFLVSPERQLAISQDPKGGGTPEFKVPGANQSYYTSSVFQTSTGAYLPVSWLGVNDLSARPTNTAGGPTTARIVLNTLGDLTNRENRAFYQRFVNDIVTNVNPGLGFVGDGLPDDENQNTGGAYVGDGVPDFYPTLYYGALASGLINIPQAYWSPLWNNHQELMCFPYVFPGAYSRPDPNSASVGWIHTPDPTNTQLNAQQLNALNHSPLDVGDSLPGPTQANQQQTWWGFPTWRETLSENWVDPQWGWLSGGTLGQPFGLHFLAANALPGSVGNNLLPPMTAQYQATAQYGADGVGLPNLAVDPNLAGTNATGVWVRAWEDDLILSGVRSFDVKAYDDTFPGYVDLGWGDDARITGGTTYLTQTPLTTTWNATTRPTMATMAHEGRMPPLTTDLRTNPNYRAFNVGDDSASTVRLRRVWDSWSTDYTNAPATGYNPQTLQPMGAPFSAPIYPSYPAPYPAPLRGLQIQIRVVDPKNEKVKVLTIREDFTDRL